MVPQSGTPAGPMGRTLRSPAAYPPATVSRPSQSRGASLLLPDTEAQPGGRPRDWAGRSTGQASPSRRDGVDRAWNPDGVGAPSGCLGRRRLDRWPTGRPADHRSEVRVSLSGGEAGRCTFPQQARVRFLSTFGRPRHARLAGRQRCAGAGPPSCVTGVADCGARDSSERSEEAQWVPTGATTGPKKPHTTPGVRRPQLAALRVQRRRAGRGPGQAAPDASPHPRPPHRGREAGPPVKRATTRTRSTTTHPHPTTDDTPSPSQHPLQRCQARGAQLQT